MGFDSLSGHKEALLVRNGKLPLNETIEKPKWNNRNIGKRPFQLEKGLENHLTWPLDLLNNTNFERDDFSNKPAFPP